MGSILRIVSYAIEPYRFCIFPFPILWYPANLMLGALVASSDLALIRSYLSYLTCKTVFDTPTSCVNINIDTYLWAS